MSWSSMYLCLLISWWGVCCWVLIISCIFCAHCNTQCLPMYFRCFSCYFYIAFGFFLEIGLWCYTWCCLFMHESRVLRSISRNVSMMVWLECCMERLDACFAYYCCYCCSSPKQAESIPSSVVCGWWWIFVGVLMMYDINQLMGLYELLYLTFFFLDIALHDQDLVIKKFVVFLLCWWDQSGIVFLDLI